MTYTTTIQELTKKNQGKWIELRRELHRFPELSLEEKNTAQRVTDYLQSLGLTVTTNVGAYGLVVNIHGAMPGPTIALRADMDALPIQEETDLPFKSTVSQVMHACGHDGHTSILAATAELLLPYVEQMKGNVRLIFQSAEEIVAGARLMIEAGVLEGVDEIYGLHNLPTLSAGFVGTRNGPLMGSVDRLEIQLEGRGGHGAMPEQSADPIVAQAAIVQGLQTAISREISPFESAVVTIGSIQAGKANNIIPQRVTMTGTVRTFSPNIHATMPDRIHRIVQNIAAAYRCHADIKYTRQVPVLVNHEMQTRHVEQIADSVLGKDFRIEAPATLAGEDFSLFLEEVPGSFFWIGSGPQENAEQAYGLHHPKFNLHEECIPVGAMMLAAITLDRLSVPKEIWGSGHDS